MKKIIGIIALCICVATCLLGHKNAYDLSETEKSKVYLSALMQDNDNTLFSLSIITNNFNNEATLLNVNKPNGTSRAKSQQQRLLQQVVYFNTSILSYSHSKINQTISLYETSSLWGRTLLNYIRILQV